MVTWPPSPNVGDTVTGPQGAVWQWDGAKWIFLAGTPVKPQLKMSVQVFTSNGTYTPPAGLQSAIVECVGGGGAGGAVSGTVGLVLGSGGGSSGGYSRSLLSAAQIGTSQAVTIGAGGANSTGGGSQGGTTSFGTLVTANGGGPGGNSDGVDQLGVPGTPAAPGTGQLALRGVPGTMGFGVTLPGTIAIAGQGGSIWGGGAIQVATSANPGAQQGPNGVNGGGGGGSATISSGFAVAGGAGGGGICLVTEYSF